MLGQADGSEAKIAWGAELEALTPAQKLGLAICPPVTPGRETAGDTGDDWNWLASNLVEKWGALCSM